MEILEQPAKPAEQNAPHRQALTVSDVLLAETYAKSSSIVTRQVTSDIAGSLSAGIVGTCVWSLSSKSKYGLAAQVIYTALSAGTTKVAVKSGFESVLLPSEYHKTSSTDFGWGIVDGFAGVAGSKVDQMASAAYTRRLGYRYAGRAIGAEMAATVGEKALTNSIRDRIALSAVRGTTGGMAGSFVWSVPHALHHNSEKLNTMEGWRNVGGEVSVNTLVGTAFGGVFASGITTVANGRDIYRYARGAVQGDRGVTRIDVLHFNDTHSAIIGEQASLPQLATEANRLRAQSAAQGRNSLLFELGDNYSGNVVAGYTKTGLVETKAVQIMKPDGFIPGNHVADAGMGKVDIKGWVDNMRSLRQELGELPAIATNLEVPGVAGIVGETGIYKPYRILEVAGKSGAKEKIGVIGLVTEELEAVADRAIQYRPHLEAAERTIAKLNEQGIDKIIVLSHLGRGKDVELATQLKGKVSAIVGAHSHDIEPVPLWIRNAHNGSDIPVVQAGSKSGWLGELNLAIKTDGTADKYRTFGRLHEIHSGIKPHPEMKAYIESQIGDVASLAQKTYPAKITEPFSMQGVRGEDGRQTALGSLVSKGLLTEVNERLPQVNEQRALLGLQPLQPLQIMLKHTGDIRESVVPGTVDHLKLSNVFINTGTAERELNELCTIRVTGDQLKRILSFSTHDLAPAPVARTGFLQDLRSLFSGRKSIDAHDYSGNFIQPEGIRYSFNRALPADKRILSVEVFDRATNKFVPLEGSKTYEALTLFHPVDKWGKTGLLTRNRLDPNYHSAENWVFGKEMMSAEARALVNAQPVKLSQVDMLAAYLQRQGTVSPKNFVAPETIRDLTPKPWVPPLKPAFFPVIATPSGDVFTGNASQRNKQQEARSK